MDSNYLKKPIPIIGEGYLVEIEDLGNKIKIILTFSIDIKEVKELELLDTINKIESVKPFILDIGEYIEIPLVLFTGLGVFINETKAEVIAKPSIQLKFKEFFKYENTIPVNTN